MGSHYFGAEPAVDIEKATYGEDADEPAGPSVTVGGAVRWTYVVTNSGNVPLTAVTVTDNVEDASRVDCDGTGRNTVAGPLAPGESFTCTATGTATIGQYANLGTVTAAGPATTDVNGDPIDGIDVTDQDWSHYRGVAASARPPSPLAQALSNLAQTGGSVGVIPITGGVVLVGAGILFLRRRRRSSRR